MYPISSALLWGQTRLKLITQDIMLGFTSVAAEKLLYGSRVTRFVQDTLVIMHWLQYSWYQKLP